ncbi:signal peptidase I [Candidatus Bathyarchaeota archaeon]|nr:signal peptidase I [Candidatus Bathyarchaeota archaeon]
MLAIKKENKGLLVTLIVIGSFIGGAFAAFGILKVVMKTPIPVVVVTSKSMEPNIHEGDILFIKNQSADEINVGDVIVFETQGAWSSPINEPVVHRVIQKDFNVGEQKYYFTTQGDANPFPDDPIPEDNLYGRVVGRIPYLGWIKLFLDRSGIGIYLLIGIGVLLVISIIMDFMKEKEHIEGEQEAGNGDEIDHPTTGSPEVAGNE